MPSGLGVIMIDRLTTFQKIRIRLSDFSFMRRPLRWFDSVYDRVGDIFSGFGVYMRYIMLLFLLTLLFLFLKIIYRYFINWHRVSFSDLSDVGRMRYWQRYTQVEEVSALNDAISLFEEVKKQGKVKKVVYLPIGFDLFHLVMQSVGQGLSDNEILKILPSNYSLIDVAPLIESIRGFRDLAAQKILEPKTRRKREYEPPMAVPSEPPIQG